MQETSIVKQLELIDKKMSETASTANDHLAKFLFGGLIATIALLNTDLLIIKDYNTDLQRLAGSLIVSIVALVLAHKYFLLVIKQYNEHRKSHRKLKYKYELTLHCLLSRGQDSEYQNFLETGITEIHKEEALKFPDNTTFQQIAKYLQDHHGRKLAEIKDRCNLFYLAMDIVYLTLAVKILSMVINYYMKSTAPMR